MKLVWTAINRELHSNKLRAIEFLSEQGHRQKVQIEDLPNFLQSNYVSNLVCSLKGDIQGIGIELSNLGTYNLTTRGEYRFTPGIGEQQILYKAQPYILNKKQQRKLDRKNNKKDSDNDLLSGAQKVAIATAVVGATAVGVSKVGKSIGNQIKQGKVIEIQEELLNRLLDYEELIDEIINIKNKTNRKISLNKQIVAYSRNLDCSNTYNENLKEDLLKYGVLDYINNIAKLIQTNIETAQSYGVYEIPLNNVGNTGTIKSLCEKLFNKIYTVQQLHMQTAQLLNNNRQFIVREAQARDYLRQIEIEQSELVNRISLELDSIHKIVSGDNECDIALIDLASIKDNIELIDNEDIKNEYHDYLYSIESLLQEKLEEMNSRNVEREEEQRIRIERKIRNIAFEISNLKNSLMTEEDAKVKIEELEQRLEDLRSHIREIGGKIKEDYGFTVSDMKHNLHWDKKDIIKDIKYKWMRQQEEQEEQEEQEKQQETKQQQQETNQTKSDSFIDELDTYRRKINNLRGDATKAEVNKLEEDLNSLAEKYSNDENKLSKIRSSMRLFNTRRKVYKL